MDGWIIKATPSHMTLQEAGQLPDMVPTSQSLCLLLLPRSADTNSPPPSHQHWAQCCTFN